MPRDRYSRIIETIFDQVYKADSQRLPFRRTDLVKASD